MYEVVCMDDCGIVAATPWLATALSTAGWHNVNTGHECNILNEQGVTVLRADQIDEAAI